MIGKKLMKYTPVLALSMFVGVANAAVVELTTNGNFETGDTSGWQDFTNGTTQTFGVDNTSPDPAGGTWYGVLNNTQLASGPVIKQANIGIGVVNPGDEITISFLARGEGSVGGVAFAEFFSELTGGGTSAAEILGGAPLALTSDWSEFEFVTNAGPDVSGGVTLQFNAATGGGAGSLSLLELDNVSVSVNAVPVPAAVWLFGSGLLGLVGVARRKKAGA